MAKSVEKVYSEMALQVLGLLYFYVAVAYANALICRFMRSVIELFPDTESAGIDDSWKIAEFFQKAGIPYKPIIAGGRIANFQIEHVWVESQIPYANYRGVVIDSHGKTWLGLDTSIKVKDYVYNNPKDVFELSAMSNELSAMRDEYLSGVQTQTPLEYLKTKLSAMNYELTDYVRTRTLPEEHMKILPAGMQFKEIAITNEYAAIPDALKHKVRFIAKNSQNSELLNFELDLMKLSSQQIAISYEPETVEDQEIINSYSGLDNTPSYLVRLRPVLKINGERIVVARDGLPMGSEYQLTIELRAPGSDLTSEQITNTMIVGNLSVIGIVSQRATSYEPSATSQDKDAERLLYEAANHYIDRWNKAEDELASLLHLSIARPLPTVVTVGGVIDVTYLLDTPHGFEWKGVFIDADVRAIETVASDELRVKTFMQLSSLQGSVLENRIFEDDFQVQSISTAKLFQLATSQPENPQPATSIITIDKTNIDTILPTLSVDNNIKEDITNSVNQSHTIRIPQSEILYQDWTGIGYIKEDPETGESGWMLSGMIAGGCPVDTQWLNQYYQGILSQPYTGPSNNDPLSASFILKIPATDKQTATVGTKLFDDKLLAVYVSDSKGLPVKGAVVTFRAIAGGGNLRCLDLLGLPSGTPAGQCDSLPTNKSGIARVQLILGKNTGDNPIYDKIQSTDTYYSQIGLNLVTASVKNYAGELSLSGPFEIYGKPDVPTEIKKVLPLQDSVPALVNTPAGTLWANVVDQYGNPVSNVNLTFTVQDALSGDPVNEPLPAVYRNLQLISHETCTNPYPIYGDCSSSNSMSLKSQYFGAMVDTLIGNTLNTLYSVKVTAPGQPSVSFGLNSLGYRTSADEYVPSLLALRSLEIVNSAGAPVNAAKAGTELNAPLTAEMLLLQDDYDLVPAGACTKYDGTTIPSGYNLISKGTVNVKKIAGGSVNFTPSGGSVTATQDIGLGQYQTWFTIGANPAVNTITASGSASVTVPEVLAVPVSGGYYVVHSCLQITNGDLPHRTIALQGGQWPIFNYYSHNLIDNNDGMQKPVYTVYGIDTQLTINPAPVLLNDDGLTTADTTFTYTILPPQYNAVRADLDFFTKADQDSSEAWTGYGVGDKSQGQGSVVFVRGSKFDANLKNLAQVVLNRGSDIEVRGDKETLPIGQLELFTVPTSTTEAPIKVVGAVTDDVTKLKLQLTVKYGSEDIPDLNWRILDPELLSNATNNETGSLLNAQGSVVDSLPVVFENGVAKATFRVPKTFVRFGTSQEAMDKERPERNVQIHLTDSNNGAQGLSAIQLKRPPVVLVHGLWGDAMTWDKFEPLIQANTGRYKFIRADYSNGDFSNNGSISINAPIIGTYMDRALDTMEGQQFAATKVDLVAHSLGGLVTRKYCEDNLIDCDKHVRKLITIDTPHQGSELADLLVIYRDHKDLFPDPGNDSLIMPSCHTLINWFVRGKRFSRWRIPAHPLGRGIDDLASGRWTEYPFNLVGSGNWTGLSALGSETSGLNVHTVAGIATATGHDIPIWFLWKMVLEPCGFTRARVFPAEPDTNDRIVTMSSQQGIMPLPATATEQVSDVDHSSILNDTGTITRLRDLLDSKVEPPNFLMEQ